MHVIATAGHVDHGKSTLVRALTGTDPDRLEEEHRRGLSIQLGYAWTELPGVGDVAFVDVPGHERFIATMLAGIGPVPAVLFVVAADDPWMPQAAEHLAALDALGVDRGVLAVTRSDLVDPGPALARARAELDRTGLRDAPAVAVSGRTGQGLGELRDRLVELVSALPQPSEDADVRLWLDRCFHVKGAGTVVTGTLPSGRIAVGDTLWLGSASSVTDQVRVRGIESLGRSVEVATGVARVALNLAGAGVEKLDRSSVLVSPEAWTPTGVVDVRLEPGAGERAGELPERPLLHMGATAVAVRVRPLGEDGSAVLARLSLDRPLPLRIGDRALLRDPGSRAVWGALVLDPAPAPLLRRRGSAGQLARSLARLDGRPAAGRELARRGIARVSDLRRIGVQIDPTALESREVGVAAGDWVLSPEHADELRRRMVDLVQAHEEDDPLSGGMSSGELAQELALPTLDLLWALVAPPLMVRDGRVTSTPVVVLPEELEKALAELRADLTDRPFAAPNADRMAQLGLDAKAVAAAVKADRLLRLAPGIVLLPGATELAAKRLAELPQPFTTSQARARLDTSRRVALPLLELLDRAGVTRRLPDDRRELRAR